MPAFVDRQSSAQVQVGCGGQLSEPVPVALAGVTPANFTLLQSGTGQGAILNQDFSVNGPGNAASRGSYVAIYGTGFGIYQSPGADGLARLSATVTAFVGGVPSQVVYAGNAPGFTSGLQQINVLIPLGAPVGNDVPISLVTTGRSTQPGVTVSVQ